MERYYHREVRYHTNRSGRQVYMNSRQKNEKFRQLIEDYTPLIKSLVAKYMGSYGVLKADEDDLKQEALIALYSAALSYKEDKGVTFGLYAKICIENRLTTYAKKITKNPEPQTESIDDCFNKGINELAADIDGQPIDRAASKETWQTLKERIKAELTDYEYNVFMSYADGESPSQIAKKLGKEPKSVYNTLQRARKKLKKLTLQ